MIRQEIKLKEIDPRLADAVRIAASIIPDLQIICGYRGKEDQEAAFKAGTSKLHYPQSKHNLMPSRAVDLAIVRNGQIDWNSTKDWFFLAGVMRLAGKQVGIDITWGGDWDSDLDFKDQSLNDFPHFELRTA